jgi:hypothetical protein
MREIDDAHHSEDNADAQAHERDEPTVHEPVKEKGYIERHPRLLG